MLPHTCTRLACASPAAVSPCCDEPSKKLMSAEKGLSANSAVRGFRRSYTQMR